MESTEEKAENNEDWLRPEWQEEEEVKSTLSLIPTPTLALDSPQLRLDKAKLPRATVPWLKGKKKKKTPT